MDRFYRALIAGFAAVLTACAPAGARDDADYSSTAIVSRGAEGADDQMLLGNPSNATESAEDKDNYLMRKPQYAIAYNSSKGIANWSSWHLSKDWIGDVPRDDSFSSDSNLPDGFTKVYDSWYTNSGFDRGHLCAAEDRSDTKTNMSATFVMTNVVPQAPDMNRKTWKVLENYERKLIHEGHEIYKIMGPHGVGGSGTKGSADTIHDGQITVPASIWKILVILPEGDDDLDRVDKDTRVIAVNVRNTQSADDKPVWDYRVSVRDLEKLTGYDFLSNVPKKIQDVIESKVDDGPTE